MKAKLFFIFSIVILNSFAQTPRWEWAKSLGSGNIKSITTDAAGNVLVTGHFNTPTIVFGSTALTNASGKTFFNMFLVKYNTTGNVLWARSAGGIYNDAGSSVTTDAAGNVFVAGYFTSPTIVFGSITLEHAKDFFREMFLVKYDAEGNVQWAKSGVGIRSGETNSLVTDAAGNIFVAGFFDGPTIVFDSINLTNLGGGDMFLVKYNASGNVLWAKSAGGKNKDMASSVVTDVSGNCYVVGNFESQTISFSSAILKNAGGYDMFLVKYSAVGNILWVKSVGGKALDYGTSVASDAFGNIFVEGFFSSPSLVVGSINLKGSDSTGNFSDMFLVKYNDAGTVQWAKNAGGACDYAASVTSDASGNVIVSGSFGSNTIVFGSDTLTNSGNENLQRQHPLDEFYVSHCDSGMDIFLAKYDSKGKVLWAKSTGGKGLDVPSSITTDASGNIFLTGYYESEEIDFDSNTLSGKNGGMFIAKLGTLSNRNKK